MKSHVAVKSHVAAPVSTNSQRLTKKTTRQELVVICACTGPVEAGLGAVYVERGEKTAETMLTHTYTEKLFQGTLPSFVIQYEEAFVFKKTIKKGSRFALARLIMIPSHNRKEAGRKCGYSKQLRVDYRSTPTSTPRK